MTLENTLPARLRLIRFVASNIKRVKLVAFSPTSAVVQVTGKNGAGKSSVLDCFEYGLMGKRSIPSEPIRTGEQEAYTILDFDAIVVKREFTRDARTEEERDAGVPPYEGTFISVRSKKGADFKSPQKMLDKLWSELAHDPVKFAELMSPREQLDVLRGVVKLDIDLDAVDLQIERDFETRTGVGRERKELEARVAAYLIDPEWPMEPIDVSALLAEMEAAAERTAQWEREIGERKSKLLSIAAYIGRANERRENARRLLAEADELDAAAASMTAAHDALPALPEMGDEVGELRRRVEAAQEANQKVRLRQEAAQLQARLDAKTAEEDALTVKIEHNRRLRDRSIANAKFPVAGLSFGKGEILFNGLPLNQAAKSAQIRIAMAVVMAQNPQLGIVLIRHGSLLDDESWKLVEQMAEEHDFQVIGETVDTTGEVGIYLEEGSIAHIQPGVAEALT